MITKELAFVYIVNGKKFLKKEDAVDYMNKVKEKKKVRVKLVFFHISVFI